MVELLLFDNEFGLSGSEISKEEGKDACCYIEEASLTKEAVEDFESKSVSSSSGFSVDKSENNSERAAGDTFKR